MIWFKKMVELAPQLVRRGMIIKTGNHISDADNQSIMHLDQFYSYVKEARNFVYADPYKLDISDRVPISTIQEFTELDLPFKTCSFELLNNCIFISKTIFRCILIHEESPRNYNCYALEEYNENEFGISTWRDARDCETTITSIVESLFLSKLQQSKLICENVKEKVRIGTGQNRTLHTIRQIIHIRPKNETEIVKSICGGRLDFSHRFEVRGHWRKTDNLGKDRDGNYCVNGMTWVVPHTKGPEELPLIKKVRVANGFTTSNVASMEKRRNWR